MTFIMRVCLALLMALGVSTFAQAAERFTFARPAAPESTVDPGDRLDVVIDRWSTDAERDRLLSVMKENGTSAALEAFRDVGRVGVLRWPGGLEYTVRYARREPRPDGGADVVLVLDRAMWVWWESGKSTEYPFTVVHLRMDKDGAGEGRVSLTTEVASDPKTGVALADFSKAPMLLAEVRHERNDS